MAGFDDTTEVPPRSLQPGCQVRSTPYIYSDDEITALMDLAAGQSPEPWGTTLATLIGLMAATGLRPAEVRRIDRDHVDLKNAQLTVWHSKFGKSRRLPLHDSTVEALSVYEAKRHDAYPRPVDDAFFLSDRSARMEKRAAGVAFRQLRAAASIEAPFGHRPPHLGDLRHTFAVSTLLSWHRAGVDVQRQLPVLSAYMGHRRPKDTYWYLEATPELMALVAERLESSWEAGR